MSKGIILDLCGGTGAWSKPYKDAGYDVRLITLPDYDVLTYEPPEGVVGILAAPPCTMFSLARRTAKTPPDFAGAMEIVFACLRIISKCRQSGSLKFWALENPVGLLRQFLGKPPMTIEQWWFGDGSIKRSDIWGYYNEPKRDKNAIRPDYDPKKWSSPSKPAGFEHLKLDRAAIRAITPQGFAQEFYKANK